MIFNKRFLTVIGMMAVVLFQNNANATLVNCPSGCFCLNNGKYDNNYVDSQYCNVKAQIVPPSSTCETGLLFFDGGIIVCVRSPENNGVANYFLDQFSVLYEGYFGFYGSINNEIIYMPRDSQYQSMYNCPANYPYSASGAKALTDCFKYDANGQKVYYGATQTITCPAGKYLPANATQCADCSAAQHHICPGGNFEKMNRIQGLRVECYPGQYLSQGATQCSSCDNDFYLCSGGIYNAGEMTDQGRIKNNGYVFNGNHSVAQCQPGYFMPAMANQCAKCTDVNAPNRACPGGVFYTDGQYQFARGTVVCAYGHSNSDHTECVATSTMPSFMLEQMTAMQQNQPEKGSQQPQPVVSGQQTQSVTKGQRRLSFGKAVAPKSLPVVPSSPVSTPTTDTSTQQQDELEVAKKLISAGVSAPVK